MTETTSGEEKTEKSPLLKKVKNFSEQKPVALTSKLVKLITNILFITVLYQTIGSLKTFFAVIGLVIIIGAVNQPNMIKALVGKVKEDKDPKAIVYPLLFLGGATVIFLMVADFLTGKIDVTPYFNIIVAVYGGVTFLSILMRYVKLSLESEVNDVSDLIEIEKKTYSKESEDGEKQIPAVTVSLGTTLQFVKGLSDSVTVTPQDGEQEDWVLTPANLRHGDSVTFSTSPLDESEVDSEDVMMPDKSYNHGAAQYEVEDELQLTIYDENFNEVQTVLIEK